MIKLSATALIHYISPVMQVTENFQKRELILNDSWEREGKTYPNFVVIEFSGDKMSQLDNFTPGQRVTVEAYVNGREYQGRVYNTIRGQTVVHYQPQQSNGVGQYPAAPAPAPGYAAAPAPTTAPAYPQQAYPQSAPGYPQQPYGQPAAPTYPQQAYVPASGQQAYGQQPHSPGVADLPFPAQ